MRRAAFLALGLLAACGETPAQRAEPRPVPARALEGQTWVLDRIGAEPVSTPVTAVFAGDTVSGVAPCNRSRGLFAEADGKLSFGPLATTRRICPAQALENRFLAAMDAVEASRFTAAQMELLDGSGAPLLVFVAAN